jgi:lysyl-tRNA synthetase class 2
MVGPKAVGEHLIQRSRILNAVRNFFVQHDYLEVETPIRIPAPAPEAHIDAISSDSWYLHTSPELCMKRLLAIGYEKIFQICKCFRKNERGERHLPEMTMLEWYTAHQDYYHMMNQCEALITSVVDALYQSSIISYQKKNIDLTPPWPKLTVAQAFDRYAQCPASVAIKKGHFDEIMALQIEPHLGWEQPIFLHDYPSACGALARLKPDAVDVAERFELYIGGLELCNGFSELTDPVEQRRRFEGEIETRRDAGKAIYPLPESFLDALAHMPEATGNALGLDRLAMLLTDAQCIDEVVAFTPEVL